MLYVLRACSRMCCVRGALRVPVSIAHRGVYRILMRLRRLRGMRARRGR